MKIWKSILRRIKQNEGARLLYTDIAAQALFEDESAIRKSQACPVARVAIR